jgi:hypothetical protein
MATETQSNGEELKYRTQIAQMNADSNSKELHGNEWIAQSEPSLTHWDSMQRRAERRHATNRQAAKNPCAEPNLSNLRLSISLSLCGCVAL